MLGSGWGAVKLLQTIDTNLFEVVVISPRNHFVVTPLLASASVGTLGFHSIVEPIRGFRPNVTFYEAQCTAIDLKAQTVEYESSIDNEAGIKGIMAFDKLVIAVGQINNTFGIPGVREHCFFLKHTSDARTIRRRIVELFEYASQPFITNEERDIILHFAIVGGGPVGVEFAAELRDFAYQDLRRLYPACMPHVRITIVEAGPSLLSSFDVKLQAYAIRKFIKDGIAVRERTAVTGVEKGKFLLSDGTEMKWGFALWASGNAANPLVADLDLPKSKSHRLLTTEFLSLEANSNVFALGDCAATKGAELIATAQVAQQQGIWLGKYLSGRVTTPFKFAFRGAMAYVGGYEALADIPQHKHSGWFAWVLWRSFYVTTALSWKNRMLIPMYWFLTFFFGRDTSRF